ncbi:MAG: hypothetical protein Q9227_000813 [Pyrenula ochraceoflavens]
MPKGVWLENLVIRQTDSNALVTVLSSPEVWLFSTNNGFEPKKVATFPDVVGCLGIVELAHDIFYVISGNWTPITFQSTPGSYSLWEIDLRSGVNSHVPTRKIADFPFGGFLNGMTVLSPNTVLVADSLYSAVWKVNVWTSEVSVAINDTTMAPKAPSAGGVPLGINGVLVRDGYLYYDNTDRSTFNRIPINLHTGAAIGPAQTLAQTTDRAALSDDFTIDLEGNAWVTADLISELDLLPSVTNGPASAELVAKPLTDPGITGWTASKFGTRLEDLKRGSLYVTTNGGPLNYAYKNWTHGGTLVRLDTAQLGQY